MTSFVQDAGVTVARACELLGVARSTYYYEARPREPRPVDPEVRAAVLEVCRERISFGYRRVAAMVSRLLKRAVNAKQVLRIMRLEKLTLKARIPPARIRNPIQPGRQITSAPDLAYSMDSKHILIGGRSYWLQSVIECCTSEWLGYVLEPHQTRSEAIDLIERVVLDRFPQTGRVPDVELRVDNGSAYISDDFEKAAKILGFRLAYSQPRTPEDNGVVESFHAGLDRDYLDFVAFDTVDEAHATIARVFEDYNTVKPKKRLGWLTPAEFARKAQTRTD